MNINFNISWVEHGSDNINELLKNPHIFGTPVVSDMINKKALNANI